MGSSPRVWGQAAVIAYTIGEGRIIPTRMGTSQPFVSPPINSGDHPHAYGDKNYTYIVTGYNQGSSPRVWGQESLHNLNLRSRRIIPTRMGTSYCSVAMNTGDWDHPHAYGDKKSFCSNEHGLSGSSPRVWGQEGKNSFAVVTGRIIPTRMGTRICRGFV